MPRPAGHRNSDFAQKREALARRAREAIMAHGPGISLREVSATTGASMSNLLHYFGDRDGLLEAVAGINDVEAAPWLDLTARLEGESAAEVLEQYTGMLLIGWRMGLGRVMEIGLAEGLGQERRGISAVNHLLEPTLQALEAMLSRLMDRHMLPRQDARIAALALLSPILLALIHQDALSGVQCRPLDVEAFTRSHVRRWLDGYGRTGPDAADPTPPRC